MPDPALVTAGNPGGLTWAEWGGSLDHFAHLERAAERAAIAREMAQASGGRKAWTPGEWQAAWDQAAERGR